MRKFILILLVLFGTVAGLYDDGSWGISDWYYEGDLLIVCNHGEQRIVNNLGAIYIEPRTLQVWYYVWLKPEECKELRYKESEPNER